MEVTPLGIDLGTTYSVVATVDGSGRPVVLRNSIGAETTPSVVCFESPSTVLVGAAAKAGAPIRPELTVTLVKRQMGTDRLFEFHGVEYSPESISALILRALVADALPGGTGSAPVSVVVTVPAYFGIREREATQQAAILAGLDVKELVSEPLAAAYAYGLGTEGDEGGGVVVYDLGGGTFDATVLSFDDGGRVIATDGDTELGGADWDRRLADFLLERFIERADPDTDPGDDAQFMTDLVLAAEDAKRALTVTTSHHVTLRGFGRVTTVPVTRADFEAMTRDLVDSSLACVRRLLAAAQRAGAPPVRRCLLVGGSSRMPMIAAALTAEFGWRVSLHDPDLAVAKGAALRVRELTTDEMWLTPTWGTEATPTGGTPVKNVPRARARSGSIGSVVPRSFGLLIHDSKDKTGQRRFIQHVIHQNDPLPVVDRETTVATILSGQAAVRIEVYEQAGAVASDEVAANRRVLDGELTGLPASLPAGSAIRVRLSLGLDGRLDVTAEEPRSQAALRLDACIDGVVDSAERELMATALSRLTVRQ